MGGCTSDLLSIADRFGLIQELFSQFVVSSETCYVPILRILYRIQIGSLCTQNQLLVLHPDVEVGCRPLLGAHQLHLLFILLLLNSG